MDDQIYRNLSELVNLDDVGMLYLEFVVTEDKLGVTETVDLVPGGELSLMLVLFLYLVLCSGALKIYRFLCKTEFSVFGDEYQAPTVEHCYITERYLLIHCTSRNSSYFVYELY